NPLAFEIVEAKLNRERIAKKRALEAPRKPKSKRVKITGGDDTELSEEEPLEYRNESASSNGNDNGDSNRNDDSYDNRDSDNQEMEKEKQPSVPEVGVTGSVEPNYLSQIPGHLQQFIPNIFNPAADGNCGFHCVAKALGYNEDGWFRVREEMLKEASEYRAVYTKLQGSNDVMTKILERIKVETKEMDIQPDKWLSRLDHGQILANTYGRPVIFLSISSCGTYLPLR
ncbi:hypothetical protein PTTG_30869, partial [Puccinia triticina 1-1 BBBD Race 1]